ncbi:MAG: hypothetical protein RLZZ605_1403 [Bacteroidota bacterium]|jgi:hypothetical protein
METAIIYLTDKNGAEMFKTYIGKSFIDSAKRDIQRHIDSAKKNPKLYSFLDIETAEIKVK